MSGVKISDELKLKPYVSEGYLYLGELNADMGRKYEALNYLKKAEAMFQEMEMDYYFNKTQEALARL